MEIVAWFWCDDDLQKTLVASESIIFKQKNIAHIPCDHKYLLLLLNVACLAEMQQIPIA